MSYLEDLFEQKDITVFLDEEELLIDLRRAGERLRKNPADRKAALAELEKIFEDGKKNENGRKTVNCLPIKLEFRSKPLENVFRKLDNKTVSSAPQNGKDVLIKIAMWVVKYSGKE